MRKVRKCFLIDLNYTIYEQTEERIFWSNMVMFVNQNITHQTKKKEGILNVNNTKSVYGRCYYK